jgi:hypothetical protein
LAIHYSLTLPLVTTVNINIVLTSKDDTNVYGYVKKTAINKCINKSDGLLVNEAWLTDMEETKNYMCYMQIPIQIVCTEKGLDKDMIFPVPVSICK